MFEQLVRPFTSRQITTTRRIVPIKKEADATPKEAKIMWGEAGNLPDEKVQPKGVNLENIENVGFNVRGSIDKWHQSSRESDQVDIPIKDNAGNQIGAATIDRAKDIGFTGRLELRKTPLPEPGNFGYNQNYYSGPGGKYVPYLPNFQGVAEVNDPEEPKPKTDGLRKDLPSADTKQAHFKYTYPAI